jgi:hypothetical protein
MCFRYVRQYGQVAILCWWSPCAESRCPSDDPSCMAFRHTVCPMASRQWATPTRCLHDVVQTLQSGSRRIEWLIVGRLPLIARSEVKLTEFDVVN